MEAARILFLCVAFLSPCPIRSVPVKVVQKSMCKNMKNYYRLSHERDCRYFYECHAGSTYLLKCPDNHWYDANKQECSNDEGSSDSNCLLQNIELEDDDGPLTESESTSTTKKDDVRLVIVHKYIYVTAAPQDQYSNIEEAQTKHRHTRNKIVKDGCEPEQNDENERDRAEYEYMTETTTEAESDEEDNTELVIISRPPYYDHKVQNNRNIRARGRNLNENNNLYFAAKKRKCRGNAILETTTNSDHSDEYDILSNYKQQLNQFKNIKINISQSEQEYENDSDSQSNEKIESTSFKYDPELNPQMVTKITYENMEYDNIIASTHIPLEKIDRRLQKRSFNNTKITDKQILQKININMSSNNHSKFIQNSINNYLKTQNPTDNYQLDNNELDFFEDKYLNLAFPQGGFFKRFIEKTTENTLKILVDNWYSRKIYKDFFIRGNLFDIDLDATTSEQSPTTNGDKTVSTEKFIIIYYGFNSSSTETYTSAENEYSEPPINAELYSSTTPLSERYLKLFHYGIDLAKEQVYVKTKNVFEKLFPHYKVKYS